MVSKICSFTWSTVHLFHGFGADSCLNLTPLAKECQTHLSWGDTENYVKMKRIGVFAGEIVLVTFLQRHIDDTLHTDKHGTMTSGPRIE